jgi:hypothetical protein
VGEPLDGRREHGALHRAAYSAPYIRTIVLYNSLSHGHRRDGPGGPPLLNGANEIFDELFASPLVKLGVLGEWLFFQQAGVANQGTVDVKGSPTPPPRASAR